MPNIFTRRAWRGVAPNEAGLIEVAPTNITGKFRETFEVWPSANFTQTKAPSDVVRVDGNALGASYLVISKCPLTPGAETFVDTVLNFSMPVEVATGLHLSQNVWGQDHSIEFLDIETVAAPAELEIASITQTTTTLTVDTVLPHDMAVGKRIGIRDCSDPRVNYPSVVVASILSPTSFTVTGGPNGALASKTVTDPTGAKGFVYFRPALSSSRNGTALHFEAPSTGLGFFYTRASAGDALPFATGSGNALTARQAVAVASTASVAQVASAPFTYSFIPTAEYKLVCQADRLNWVDQTIDGVATATNRVTRTQVVPNDSKTYKVRIRSISEKSMTVPVGEIVSVSKTGTTTATVVTAAAHNLVTGDTVVGYGVRDVGTGFYPALATAAAVTVVDATTFTVVWGTAATNTSYGGFIAKIQGDCPLPGIVAQSIQSIAKATAADGQHILTVVGSATWAGVVIGDHVNLYGVRDASTGALLPQDPNGVWKVANLATSTLTLVNVPDVSPVLADFVSVNCGGGVLKRTDLRISYLRIFDYLRQRVEIMPRPAADAANAVNVGGAVSVSGSLTTVSTVTTVTTVSAVTAANLALPGTIADVASAALTTTTTTAAFTPTFGTAYLVNIPVTVFTATSLDVSVEESDDAGTNWYKVYDFPRITATGIYKSPILRLRGNRVRYVQTFAGTTCTRAINRLQISHAASQIVQLIDRTIVPNTLNSVTPAIIVEGCQDFNFVVRCTAQTTAATIAPQFSLDGVNWHTGTPTLTTIVGLAHGKVGNEQWKFARLIVTAAGTGITLGEVAVTGVGV
jgi:hypothetical protein